MSDGQLQPLVVIPCVVEQPRLDDCIAAVIAGRVSPTRIVVVVDGGGASAAHSRDDDGVMVVGTPHRRGFAAACNHGVAALATLHGELAEKTPVVLLNDDATLAEGWTSLLEELESPQVGAVSWAATGPRGPRRAYPAVERGDGVRIHEGPTLSGCAFATTLATWDGVGGLDERFTMYGEETDLFRKLQRQGLDLLEGAPAVWHEGEGSAVGRRIRTTWFGIRNPLWVSILHDPRRAAARTLAVTIVDSLSLRRLGPEAEAHRRRRRAASWPVRLVLLGLALGHTLVSLPALLRGRRERA